MPRKWISTFAGVLPAAVVMLLAGIPSPAAADSDWQFVTAGQAKIIFRLPDSGRHWTGYWTRKVRNFSRNERAAWKVLDATDEIAAMIWYLEAAGTRFFVTKYLTPLPDMAKDFFDNAVLGDKNPEGVKANEWDWQLFDRKNPSRHCVMFRKFFSGALYAGHVIPGDVHMDTALGHRQLFGWYCDDEPVDPILVTSCVGVMGLLKAPCSVPTEDELAYAKGNFEGEWHGVNQPFALTFLVTNGVAKGILRHRRGTCKVSGHIEPSDPTNLFFMCQFIVANGFFNKNGGMTVKVVLGEGKGDAEYHYSESNLRDEKGSFTLERQ